jgi:hypothetical protein
MKKYFMVLGAIIFFGVISSIPVFAYSISGQVKFQNAWEQKSAFWDRAAFLFSNFKAGQNKNMGAAKVTRPVVAQEPEWSQQLNSMRAFATSA